MRAIPLAAMRSRPARKLPGVLLRSNDQYWSIQKSGPRLDGRFDCPATFLCIVVCSALDALG